MTRTEIENLNVQLHNWMSDNLALVDKVAALETENQELRHMLVGMKDVCATAIKNACIEAVRGLPDLPPPRMPSVAQLTVVPREAS